ncbi:MAG: helix-turn-helix transcriptional regulator [Acidobacteriota bacterium]
MATSTGFPFHRALKVLRIALDWGQAQLAQAAGLSRSAMSEIESGDIHITWERLETFAALMNAPPGAVAAALAFVATLVPWVDAEAGPAEPTLAERRSIEEAVAAGALELRSSLLGQMRQRHAEEERAKATSLWRRLAGKTAKQRRFVVEQAPEVWSWALVERLSHESGIEASDSARQAVQLAELALWVAERVSGSEGWRGRVQGYAWGYLSSACRVANDFERSRTALGRANDLFPRGAEEDPGLLDPVRLLDLEASFWRDQRQFAKAMDLHDKALAEGSEGLRGRLLLKRAFTLEVMGKSESALLDLVEALPLVERAEDQRQRLVVRFNLVVSLLSLGRADEAQSHLPKVRALALQLGGELDSLRLRWLEGRVAEAFGRREEAIVAYESLVGEFCRLNQGADAALAGLEAAALHLEVGRHGRVKQLSAELRPQFGAHGLEQEELASVRLFLEAAERETATVALAREAARAWVRACAVHPER